MDYFSTQELNSECNNWRLTGKGEFKLEIAELNEWFSLAASVAVLAGIIFLIIEIKQNTKSHQSDSRKALLSNDQTSLLVALDHHDIFQKMNQPETLSQADQYRLSFIFAIDIRNREFEYFEYTSGAIDEDTWKSYKDLILMNHTTKRGRNWWNKVGRELVNPEFCKMVEKMLAEHPTTELWDTLGNWDEEPSDA
ncbi:MAG: hypothetical protein ACI9IA_001025 [Enterobacterales bacterium]